MLWGKTTHFLVYFNFYLFICLLFFMNVLSLMALQDKPWCLSKARKHAQHSALREVEFL